MIMMFGHEKGGVGKSTLAITFAAHLARAGYNVVLVDADESRNSSKWGELRTSMGLETDFTIVNQSVDPTTNILKLSKSYQVVVVDVGAGDYDRLIDMSRIVDLWIAPTATGQKDADCNVNIIEHFASANRRHKNGKIPLAFVFNKAPSVSNSTEAPHAIEALREFAPEVKVLNSYLCDRKVFRDADRHGKTIFEMSQGQRAKAEGEFINFANEAFKFYEETKQEVTHGHK
jgi:chromosome partitioning protein